MRNIDQNVNIIFTKTCPCSILPSLILTTSKENIWRKEGDLQLNELLQHKIIVAFSGHSFGAVYVYVCGGKRQGFFPFLSVAIVSAHACSASREGKSPLTATTHNKKSLKS